MTTSNFKRLLYILEQFEKRPNQTLDMYDVDIQREFGISPKTVGRLLDQIAEELDSIEVFTQNRRKSYRLIKPVDIFTEAFDHSHEIGWLFNLAQEADPELFSGLEKLTRKNNRIYHIKNSPAEDIKTLEQKEIFKHLKRAVERREYRKITFKGKEHPQDNLKCLKLMFMEGNWYVAYVEADQLCFGRISFIEKVEYATNASTYQPAGVQKQMDFLETVQNAMTRYDRLLRSARLQALPPIAKYFERGMKPFLSTQQYEKTLEDGSVIFTLNYTQSIEILPFIQKWLPDMVILSPQELKEKYLKRLNRSITLHNET